MIRLFHLCTRRSILAIVKSWKQQTFKRTMRLLAVFSLHRIDPLMYFLRIVPSGCLRVYCTSLTKSHFAIANALERIVDPV